MPPRAFPYPLKLGIDICHIPRIKALLTSKVANGEKATKPLSRFLAKVLTWPERQYFWLRFQDQDTAYKDINKVAQYLAGRWAAKEACRKACTHLGMSNGLHHIMILPISTRAHEAKAVTAPPQGLILRESLPPFLLEGATTVSDLKDGMVVARVAPSRFDINAVDGQFCEVSISHDDEFAQAVAMVPTIDWAKGDVKRDVTGLITDISKD